MYTIMNEQSTSEPSTSTPRSALNSITVSRKFELASFDHDNLILVLSSSLLNADVNATPNPTDIWGWVSNFGALAKTIDSSDATPTFFLSHTILHTKQNEQHATERDDRQIDWHRQV